MAGAVRPEDDSMKNTFEFLGLGASIAVFSLFSACSSGSGTAASAGGTGSTGETGGAGGDVGGSSGVGGNTSTGKSETGGGGSTAYKVTTLYNFNTELQNFKFGTSLETAPYVNLVNPGDASVSSTPPTLAWASKDYDGAAATPGSMMIEATYTNWSQKVYVEVSGPSDALNNPINLKHMTLHAKVLLVKGLSPSMSAPGGIVFYIKSMGYVWGQATWKNLDSLNTWIDLRFDTDAPDPGSSLSWDAATPIYLGFYISSGGGGSVSVLSLIH